MYIPTVNQMSDQSKIKAFLKKYSFATIITNVNNVPVATHLPFVVIEDESGLKLYSHFAKANDQWKYIADNVSLVIFSEPHAYISPSNYEKIQNVPTWNYIAVHIYGKCRLITKDDEVLELLAQTIHTYETEYFAQWQSLSSAYKAAMLNGIVAFELLVDDIQAKEKLSQNKTAQERQNIINTLTKSPNTVENELGNYMDRNIAD